MVRALEKKVFTDSFFVALEKCTKFVGEPIYFVNDRYTIENLGVKNGYKWISLSNSNACAPFHSFVIGLKQDLPVKKWWKEQEYLRKIGDETYPFTYFVNYPILVYYSYEPDVKSAIYQSTYNSIIQHNLRGWWFDCPKWIDRFGSLSLLLDLLNIFKHWEKIKED